MHREEGSVLKHPQKILSANVLRPGRLLTVNETYLLTVAWKASHCQRYIFTDSGLEGFSLSTINIS
jgi:hypothetical protein